VRRDIGTSGRAVELREIEIIHNGHGRNSTHEGWDLLMVGNLEGIQKISKDNIDAMTRSFGVMPKAVQAMAAEMAEYSKRSFENGAKAMQTLLAVKSLDKAMEVQSEYAKTAYEDYAAQVTKLGQLYSELAKEAFKPYEGFAPNK
jgi:hypothetical protein